MHLKAYLALMMNIDFNPIVTTKRLYEALLECSGHILLRLPQFLINKS